MRTFDWWTVGIILGVIALLIIWDVIAGALGYKTESQIEASWARRYNSFAFFLGAFAGHIAMQSPNPHYAWWPIGAGLLLVVVAYDVAWGREWIRVPRWARYPGWWLFLGIWAGFFFWPQRWAP